MIRKFYGTLSIPLFWPFSYFLFFSPTLPADALATMINDRDDGTDNTKATTTTTGKCTRESNRTPSETLHSEIFSSKLVRCFHARAHPGTVPIVAFLHARTRGPPI